MHTFLYILVWRTGEEYADITQLSMSFLREVHKDAQILLLTDPETANALHESAHPILSLADRIIESEAPHHSSSMKSWFLKSRMRQLIDGDFLFLDADTLVRQPLDELFTIEAPIAMAENHSLRFPENFPDMEGVVYERNGWPFPSNGHYLNSGVIFWRDDPQARRLGEIWAEFWDASAACGYGYDQPSLNRAIETSKVMVHLLSDRYNAQIRSNPYAGVDAAVWHFYRTDRRWFPEDWFWQGINMIREGKDISSSWIDRACQARIPWPLHELVAEQRLIDHLRHGGRLSSAIYEQLTGMDLPSTSNACVCTIITANYLPYAKALLESVRAFEPDVHFNILISDRDRDLFTEVINDRYVFFHFAEDVCLPGIGQEIRHKYQSTDHDAFRWSCKPIFINHLIRQHEYERVLYFDCDIYIFDAFRFLFDALKEHQVLLTPHWRTKTPDTDPEEYRFLFNHGLYNAGFIGANTQGTQAMDWWAGCCLHSCARGSFEGEYVDQSILNLMPVYFEGVHVLRHKGCNVAIWNRHECQRTMHADGSVKIDNVFPIVFIHFSAGIPRSWDPMIGSFLDRYLAALKKYDEQIWERELDKRNPRRDTYIEEKGNIYLQLKRRVVQARLSLLPRSTVHNIAILAQSGTSHQCLGLWLRQVPGTVLSNRPILDWAIDGIDTLDEKIFGYSYLAGSSRSMDHMLDDAMSGKIGDPVHVNWANWHSFIHMQRMVLNFPEASLCWPEMADIIGRKHQVIALVSHPAPFAQRMMAIYGDGRHLHCMSNTMAWLKKHPTRPADLEDMTPAEYAWIIKWCLDMKYLNEVSDAGKRIIILREEDLMSNTHEAMNLLLKTLGWNSQQNMAAKFQTYCRFRHQEQDPSKGDDHSPALMGKRNALDSLMHSFDIHIYTKPYNDKNTNQQ